jgi:hypothetical protein
VKLSTFNGWKQSTQDLLFVLSRVELTIEPACLRRSMSIVRGYFINNGSGADRACTLTRDLFVP